MPDYSLRKFLAPEFLFGVEARMLTGRYVKNLGASNVLLVTDPGVISTGWIGDVITSLENSNIRYNLFKEISPNPRDHQVMLGANHYRNEKCDAIVAVGGGSVMDCAKGIGIVSTNNKNVLAFEGVDQVPVPMPPLVCIPTTAGTSADVSQFAIITNTLERVKIAIISKSVVPDIALIDPETLLSMNPILTACTGFDALVHAIEAYVSNAASTFTDMHAEEAIRLINSYLVKSVLNPDNLEYRNEVMRASLLAGLAFSNASLGCTHSLAHSLGGYLDLAHGECNAMLVPHVVNYNFESNAFKYLRIASLLGIPIGGETAWNVRKNLVTRLIEMKEEMGIMATLRLKGVRSDEINVLASKAIKDPCNATNPRTPNVKDIEIIYQEAM